MRVQSSTGITTKCDERRVVCSNTNAHKHLNVFKGVRTSTTILFGHKQLDFRPLHVLTRKTSAGLVFDGFTVELKVKKSCDVIA